MSITKAENTLEKLSVGSKEIMAARVAFFLPGFVISTWAPMIPMVKARLNLEADVLGLLLLCIGISAFICMPLVGALVQRFGCKKVVITGATLMALVSVLLSCLPDILTYAIALAFFGAVTGITDVSINTNAVIVEKLAGRRLLSGMHAFWSIGCFASAGMFSVLASLGLDVTLIAALHCTIVLALLAVFGRHLLNYKSPGGEKAFAIPRGIVIILGILACITFLVEGAIMDWSGVLLTEVKNIDIALAGTGYAIFSVAMLIMRLLGDKTVQFLGEEKAVIGGSIFTAAGFALVVIVDNLYLNALAFILIGLGCANIVPVFYSLLKYQKDMPISAAVTAITSLGYTGVILGPALLGFVAHGINISAVFELIALLLIIEAAIAKYVFCKLKI